MTILEGLKPRMGKEEGKTITIITTTTTTRKWRINRTGKGWKRTRSLAMEDRRRGANTTRRNRQRIPSRGPKGKERSFLGREEEEQIQHGGIGSGSLLGAQRERKEVSWGEKKRSKYNTAESAADPFSGPKGKGK